MADKGVEEFQKAIKAILKGADLSNLSTKKIRKQLEEKFETDLTNRKKEIDKLVMKLITENEEEEEKKEKQEDSDKEDKSNGVEEEEAGLSSGEEEVPKKKEKKSKPPKEKKKRRSAAKADDSEDPLLCSIKEMDDEDLAKKLQEEETGLRRRAAKRLPPPSKPKKHKDPDPDKKKKPSVYQRPCHLSDALAAVVGSKEMPRPEVVRTLWAIVKERNLQDPSNKQFMLCDEQMETLFGRKRIRLFGMMKQLKTHIRNLET